jgi:hypothetical protein
MLLLHKIEKTHFSPSEKEIINYVLRNSDQLDDLSIQAIADATYTSAPIVVRAAKKLGLNGWNELKKQLKSEIEYLYANDRIDGIFLKKDGSEFIYEIGLISTSPSQQVVEDYLKNGYYLIGFAYWHIGKEIDVEFITADKTLRPVFVDSKNRLYLNGVLYTGNKFIHFDEPEFPQENDVWFNTEEDVLYIFRPNKETKQKEWLPVNDLSRFSREYGVFLEAENPEDLQTFLFDSKENLRFIPNKNQLTIIIDQVVVMRDQYEELYDEAIYDDANNGCGFKLKHPLDRPSVVEVWVDHNVVSKNQDLDLFSHDAAFVRNDYIQISILLLHLILFHFHLFL